MEMYFEEKKGWHPTRCLVRFLWAIPHVAVFRVPALLNFFRKLLFLKEENLNGGEKSRLYLSWPL